jgi:hypothetical protein
MRTLGNSIDTSFVDLKGGTTGQILSKASNTDLDYTWISNQVGDITAVTAGTGITGGGTSGDVTVSFDQANYGGGQYAAGKNKILNGDFGIWQRGTSFSNPAAGDFNADRWLVSVNGTGVTRTISRQTFTAGTAPVSGYEGSYFLRYAVSVIGTATANNLIQKIEDVQTYAGQTISLSFWAKAASGFTMPAPVIGQNFGSGGSGSVYTSVTMNSTSIGTSWARYTGSVSVPSIAGKTIGTGSNLELTIQGLGAGTFTLDIWGVQVEAGSIATPFQTATGTKQGELAACQRYYYQPKAYTTFTGYSFSTTLAYCSLTLPVVMRTTPSYTLTNGDLRISSPGGDLTPSATSSLLNSDSSICFSATQTYVAGRGAIVFPATDTAIKISAEL